MDFRQKVCSEISFIENSFNVRQINYDNFPAWSVIRALIGRRLENHFLNPGRLVEASNAKIGDTVGNLNSLLAELNLNTGYSDISEVEDSRRKQNLDVLFFTWSGRNYLFTDGLFHTQEDYLYDLLEDEFSVGKFEFVEKSNKHTFPRWKKSNFIHSPMLFEHVGLLRAWIMKNYPLNLKKRWSGTGDIKPIFQHLARRYPTAFKSVNLVELTYDIEMIFQKSEVFDQILQETKPKIIISNLYYSPHCMSVLLSAKKNGIPFCEVTNGAIGKNHWAFTGVTLYKNLKEELIPDAVWVWDEYSKEYVDTYKSELWNKPNVINGGNIRYAHWKRNEKSIEVKRKQKKETKTKTILFTHQYVNLPSKELIKAIQDSSSDLKWLFRLHPQSVMLKPAYDAFFKKIGGNLEVVSSQDCPVFELLSEVDHLVTEFSTTAIEAMNLGLPVTIIGELGPELFENYISKGLMVRATNSNEILQSVSSAKLRGNRLTDNAPHVSKTVNAIIFKYKSLAAETKNSKIMITKRLEFKIGTTEVSILRIYAWLLRVNKALMKARFLVSLFVPKPIKKFIRSIFF